MTVTRSSSLRSRRRTPILAVATVTMLCVVATALLSTAFVSLAAATPVTYGPDLPRSTTDRADEVSGKQIHVIYVLPSDGTDRALDTDGTLKNSISSFQTWLASETGDRPLRFDTYQGSLDISFYEMSRTEADIESEDQFVRDAIEDETIAAGFNAPNKIYAVYYDGTSNFSCGGGAWPPTLQGNVAALYLDGLPTADNPCSDNDFAAAGGAPTYWEFGMLHEIMHTLGFVPTCAPNHHRAGHVSDDGNDLMWAGEGNWFPDGYASAVLDAGNDDYYGHSDGGCLDFSDSTFLIGNTDPDPTCPATVDVAVSGTSFTPKTATPVIGGCVEWQFNGPGNHTATEKKKLGPGTGPLFDSGSQAPGSTFTYTFVASGGYNYQSTGDPTSMAGVVKVPVKLSAGSGGVTTRSPSHGHRRAPPATDPTCSCATSRPVVPTAPGGIGARIKPASATPSSPAPRTAGASTSSEPISRTPRPPRCPAGRPGSRSRSRRGTGAT